LKEPHEEWDEGTRIWICDNDHSKSVTKLPACKTCGHFGICKPCFEVAYKRCNIAAVGLYLSDDKFKGKLGAIDEEENDSEEG
jgi:hypothetical protein